MAHHPSCARVIDDRKRGIDDRPHAEHRERPGTRLLHERSKRSGLLDSGWRDCFPDVTVAGQDKCGDDSGADDAPHAAAEPGRRLLRREHAGCNHREEQSEEDSRRVQVVPPPFSLEQRGNEKACGDGEDGQARSPVTSRRSHEAGDDCRADPVTNLRKPP